MRATVTLAYHDMSHTMEVRTDYKVPRILWENLEAVLLSQSKKYIEELAKVLKVPAKELQKRVMPSANSIKVVIQDVQEHVCHAYVQNGQFTVFCRKPVFDGYFCSAHMGTRLLVQDTNAETIQRVKDIETLPPLWVHNNNLLTSNGQKIGRINHSTQKIKIYTLNT